MKTLISTLIAAFAVVSAPAFAGSHGGGKTEGKEGELFHFGSGLAVCQQA